MKKIILSMLALAALAGCSKSEEDSQGGNGGPDGLVPIRLGSGVAMVTKAVLGTEGEPFTAGIAGWENTATEDYAGNPTWSTTIQTTVAAPVAPTEPEGDATGAQGADVTWTDQKYYNADENTTTYMKAWYPAGTHDETTKTTVTFENTDASVDVLLAPVVSGTKLTKDAPDKVLAFAHQTAQINFKVQAGAGLDGSTILRSITIRDAQLPTGFDLTQTGADAVTYATAADLAVPGITEDAVTIGETAEAAGSPVMIKPITGKTFSIDVVTSNATYSNQTVTVTSENIEAGTAYEVTLTFSQGGIKLKATVAPWKSETGSADIK